MHSKKKQTGRGKLFPRANQNQPSITTRVLHDWLAHIWGLDCLNSDYVFGNVHLQIIPTARTAYWEDVMVAEINLVKGFQIFSCSESWWSSGAKCKDLLERSKFHNSVLPWTISIFTSWIWLEQTLIHIHNSSCKTYRQTFMWFPNYVDGHSPDLKEKDNGNSDLSNLY